MFTGWSNDLIDGLNDLINRFDSIRSIDWPVALFYIMDRNCMHVSGLVKKYKKAKKPGMPTTLLFHSNPSISIHPIHAIITSLPPMHHMLIM